MVPPCFDRLRVYNVTFTRVLVHTCLQCCLAVCRSLHQHGVFSEGSEFCECRPGRCSKQTHGWSNRNVWYLGVKFFLQLSPWSVNLVTLELDIVSFPASLFMETASRSKLCSTVLVGWLGPEARGNELGGGPVGVSPPLTMSPPANSLLWFSFSISVICAAWQFCPIMGGWLLPHLEHRLSALCCLV